MSSYIHKKKKIYDEFLLDDNVKLYNVMASPLNSFNQTDIRV